MKPYAPGNKLPVHIKLCPIVPINCPGYEGHSVYEYKDEGTWWCRRVALGLLVLYVQYEQYVHLEKSRPLEVRNA